MTRTGTSANYRVRWSGNGLIPAASTLEGVIKRRFSILHHTSFGYAD